MQTNTIIGNTSYLAVGEVTSKLKSMSESLESSHAEALDFTSFLLHTHIYTHTNQSIITHVATTTKY